MQTPVFDPAPQPDKHSFSRLLVITILAALVALACNCPLLITPLSPNLPTKQSVPTIHALAPTNPAATPVRPTAAQGNIPPNVVGAWHGDTCDEAEGTYIYRWSLDLMKDPASGQVVGTLKFHDCPGGGRALFRVVGVEQAGSVITLTGTLKDGGGELFQTAQGKVAPSNGDTGTMSFTFDSITGKIEPNFAP
jgi:hypothetical protein